MLGVDPGLTRCGLAVVDGAGTGSRPALVEVGVVHTLPADAAGDRLAAIDDVLARWLDRYRPEVVALERVFAQHNLRTVMGTAQASGLVLLAAARRGIPVALHTPSEVKAAVAGDGRADKRAVGSAVTRILALEEMPRPADAADAVALALCQLWRGPGQARLALAALTAGRQLARRNRVAAAARSARSGGGPAAAPRVAS